MRQDVGIVLAVMGQHRGDDLGLVLEAVGEQRPDRPVDQARGQRLLLGRPPLALEKAARDLARSEGLFLVVDGQREEILAGLHRTCRRRRWPAPRSRPACASTAPSAWRAIRPLSRTQLAAAPVDFLTCNLEHSLTFLGQPGCRGRRQSAARRRSPAALAGAASRLDASAPQAQPLDQRLVAALVVTAQIIEQATPLTNHHQQAAPRGEVLLVRLQMLGQVDDPLGSGSPPAPRASRYRPLGSRSP